MATLDEASKCPKCQHTGRKGDPMPTQEIGKKVIVFTCENQRCHWYNTGWTVQINPDGSIPETGGRGPKQFEAIFGDPNAAIERANREADETQWR